MLFVLKKEPTSEPSGRRKFVVLSPAPTPRLGMGTLWLTRAFQPVHTHLRPASDGTRLPHSAAFIGSPLLGHRMANGI
jgi:hypothetical protein